MNRRETNTVLAALRAYQCETPHKRLLHIHNIATDCDSDTAMDSDGIDELCGRLNTVERQHWIARVQDAANNYREVQTAYFDGDEQGAYEYFTKVYSIIKRYMVTASDRRRYQITMTASPVVIQWPGE